MKLRNWLIVCLQTSTAFGGGMVTSGGEYVTTEKNPWFLGTDPVKYCVEHSDADFSVSKPQIESLIRLSLGEWTHTISQLHQHPTPAEVIGGKRAVVSGNFEAQTECSAETQLTFILGKRNPEIEETLQHSARYVIAIAKQTEFNDETGEAKGYIWVNADQGPNVYTGPRWKETGFWQHDKSLKNVLLHEIGHTLGFDHDAVGVMGHSVPRNAAMVATNFEQDVSKLLLHRWYLDRREFCGVVGVDSETGPSNLFGRSINRQLGCVRPSDDGKSVELSVRAKNSTEWMRAQIALHPITWRSSFSFGLTGRYVEDGQTQSGSHFSFPRHHSFVDFGESDRNGTLVFRNKKVAVLIETKGGARFSFVDPVTNEFRYIEISFPSYKGR